MALTAIQIDRREPAHIRALSFGGAEKRVVELAAGDLVGTCGDGTTIAVERKTPSDLLNTLRQDRLYSQAARLRAVSPWAYLVVTGALVPGPNGEVRFVEGAAPDGAEEGGEAQGAEGTEGTEGAEGAESPEARESGWSWSTVQGALLTCQEIGVCVVFGGDGADYERMVLRLARRDRGPVRVAPARGVEPLTLYESVLTGLPGVGPGRARALIRAYGTPARAIEALTRERARRLGPVAPGIGPGLQRQVRAAMGLEAAASLTVNVPLEETAPLRSAA